MKRRKNPHKKITAGRALSLLRDLDAVSHYIDENAWAAVSRMRGALDEHIRAALYRGRVK